LTDKTQPARLTTPLKSPHQFQFRRITHMAMNLEKVVPLGRSLHEYTCMFALSGEDLEKRIVGVADGPASFNAEMSTLGRTVISVDPLYCFRAGEIERQFNAVVDHVISQVKASP